MFRNDGIERDRERKREREREKEREKYACMHKGAQTHKNLCSITHKFYHAQKHKQTKAQTYTHTHTHTHTHTNPHSKQKMNLIYGVIKTGDSVSGLH